MVQRIFWILWENISDKVFCEICIYSGGIYCKLRFLGRLGACNKLDGVNLCFWGSILVLKFKNISLHSALKTSFWIRSFKKAFRIEISRRNVSNAIKFCLQTSQKNHSLQRSSFQSGLINFPSKNSHHIHKYSVTLFAI